MNAPAHLFGKDEGNHRAPKKRKLHSPIYSNCLEQANGAETTFGEPVVEQHGKTVLDRIHQSMILFAAGRGEALKRFLVEEGVGQRPALLESGSSAFRSLSDLNQRKALDRRRIGAEERSRILMSRGTKIRKWGHGMALKPWYKIVTPREDLRDDKPLDASEFAVHLDQVRDKRAPEVYQNPARFFERTFLTKSLSGLGCRGSAASCPALKPKHPPCSI